MAVVQYETVLKYNGYAKNIFLIANDALATILRRSSFTDVEIDNVVTKQDFYDAIAPYVGNISSFAFPYYWGYEGDHLNVNWLLDKFPLSYEVAPPSEKPTGSTIHIDDVYEFGNKSAGVNIANHSVSALNFSTGDVATATSLTHQTIFQNGEDLIGLIIPIFMESELANGVIHEVPSSFQRVWIKYYRNAQKVIISRSSMSSTPAEYRNYFAYVPIPAPIGGEDPYGDQPYSSTGGGPNHSGTGTSGTGGLGDTSSDPVPIPNTPTSISTGSGMFTAYNPDNTKLADLGASLWGAQISDFDDVFKLLFGGDAFNAIIGLSMIPVTPDTGSSKEIKLGNWGSGVSAPIITNQYKQVDFGSVTLAEFWGNCIDYSPYTRVQLALPYIGIVDVDTDDVIGSVCSLKYNIDVFSGAICAMLHCVKGNCESVLYQWSGSCAVQLPITGASFNAVMGAVMAVGGAVAGAVSLASGPIGAALGTVGSMGVGAGLVSGAAANMFGTMKGKVQKSNGFSACSGALGIMTPYFIVTRPIQSVPSTQQKTKGYPANISAHIGDLVGYTEFEEVHLHNMPATKDEVLEIELLLKKGVIF